MNAVFDAMATEDPGRFDFRRRLGEGFSGEDGDLRPIDRAVARWVLAHGGSPLLARVAAAASRAEGEGDSVLVLAGEGSGRFIAALSEEALARLASEPLVASAAQASRMAGDAQTGSSLASPGWAFVLDGAQFYLRRSFAHEQALAGMLRGRREGSSAAGGAEGEVDTASNKAKAEGGAVSSHAMFEGDAVPSFGGSGPTLWAGEGAAGSGSIDSSAEAVALEVWIDALFAGDRSAAVQAQRAAVAGFVERRLFVLTGGPGTGKTTTVLRMLLLRLRAHRQRTGVLPRLRLAAPTGKAAQRLGESLQSGAATLRTHGLGAEWSAALDHVIAAETGTLHRLLGSRGPARGHAWHRERRLPLDLLVVDEASMVDLALLRASFDALPDTAAVLLVGDAEQLASVGTGSVLRDLVEALQRDPRGDLVRLRHSFRAEAVLQPLNGAIAEGDIQAFAKAAATASPAFAQRAVCDARHLRAALSEHAQRLYSALAAGGVFEPLPEDELARAQAIARSHAALRETQLLCALRQGPFGALACDAATDLALKRLLGLPEGQAWYPGRAVIVLQNDYAAGLFNGDVGLCLHGADGHLRVWFEARGADGFGLRGLAPGALPQHGGGFALSVHKSQGSEYGEVVLLLPPEPEHPILGRGLLYTGATRARRAFSLWATDAALRTALSRPTQRVSGLAARLLQSN